MKRRKRASVFAPENVKRNTIIPVRFSADELALIDDAAAKLHAFRSDVIRGAALAAARKAVK